MNNDRKIIADYINTVIGICLIKDDDYCNQDLSLITEKFSDRYPHLKQAFEYALRLLNKEFEGNGIIAYAERLVHAKIEQWLDTRRREFLFNALTII